MHRASTTAIAAAAASLLATSAAHAASLEAHDDVDGDDVTTAEVRGEGGAWRTAAWDDLDATALAPGSYDVRFRADGQQAGATARLPHCAGRERIMVDGREVPSPPGPVIVPVGAGSHDIVITLAVTAYERRVACGERPRVGAAVRSVEGLGVLEFSSPQSRRGGGRAVVYVPIHHDDHSAAPLLVGLHPWNGSMWTYAAYRQLLREADARHVVLLMPSGLGNSLYTADAEDEVMRAVAAFSGALPIDTRAVSVWGASMGGAGATTIAFHRPDRFAAVTSFFGDSSYDVTSYVRAVLPNQAAAHRVNALDVVDNARHLDVRLIHGEDDRTSPVRQSVVLATALRERGFHVRFDRVPGVGHSGALVARFLPEVVASAAAERTPDPVTRVTYRSVRAADTEAYGVRIVRASPGVDAFVDVERLDDAIRVRRADGVRAIVLRRGAFGAPASPLPPIAVDASSRVDARWEPPP